MLFLLALRLADAAAPIQTIGILKRAQPDSGCRTAWLLGTDPDNPHRFCINLASASPELLALADTVYDEEVTVEGHYEGGAVSLTMLSTDLSAHNGERPALDYHIDPVKTTRSHNLGARLRENDAARIRIQPPTTPVHIELIFQGVPLEADVAGLLQRVRFKSGSAQLTPQAQMLGETLVLTLPPVSPGVLLRIEPVSGDDLTGILVSDLFEGQREKLSMTLLLSASTYDTP